MVESIAEAILVMTDRNAFPKTGKKFPECPTGKRDYAMIIAIALQSELGNSHHAIKTLMRWSGAKERTAKNWLSGVHGPSGEHLVSLIRNSDKVFDAVLSQTGRRRTPSHARLASLRDTLQSTAVQLTEILDDEAKARSH
jgi:hypothetical protein